MLGSDADANWRSIAQFSERDADAFVECVKRAASYCRADCSPRYEEFLHRVREIAQPLLDAPPPVGQRVSERERCFSPARSAGS